MIEQEAGQLITEYIRQSYAAISTEPEEFDLTPRVDLVSIESKPDEMYEAVLRIAGGRFDLRVLFWIDEIHQFLENRVHIESRQEENFEQFK